MKRRNTHFSAGYIFFGTEPSAVDSSVVIEPTTISNYNKSNNLTKASLKV